METHVFVYGTLRKDTRGQVLSPLCRDWIFLGYGTVAGELYDFGAYPGAVRADGTDAHIFGEVYELSDPEAMIPPIDRYEGCSFKSSSRQSCLLYSIYFLKQVKRFISSPFRYFH
jgi:gamma-glutamylcyclotransferase (GGCT)/AIG2-like uncharacterized protein YtfP